MDCCFRFWWRSSPPNNKQNPVGEILIPWFGITQQRRICHYSHNVYIWLERRVFSQTPVGWYFFATYNSSFTMWRISLFIILNLFLQIGNTFSQKTNPPGTTLLRDNLYIDLAPMANIHYREYEYFMSNFINYNLDSFQKLVASLPMSGVAFKEFLTQLRFEPNRDSANLKINRDATFSWDRKSVV